MMHTAPPVPPPAPVQEAPPRLVLVGRASWYATGRWTASGAPFHKYAMTAACNRLPLGTRLCVINTANRREVVLRVNDTGGFTRLGRVLDVSLGVAQKLDFVHAGVTTVKCYLVRPGH